MEQEKRINLRFSSREFEDLDNKRHSAKTSFQQLGYDFFMRWLKGDVALNKTDERKGVPAGNALGVAQPALLAEVNRICAAQKIPIEAALNHALAMYIDYQQPDSVMVRVPIFLKRPVAWMQTRLRTKSEAEVFYALLQKIIEFSRTEAEVTPHQSSHSTKSDKTG